MAKLDRFKVDPEWLRKAAEAEAAGGGCTSVGGLAVELGLMVGGDPKDEEIRRLRRSLNNLLAACVTMMRGTDLITRWPCPDCGRKGPGDPKIGMTVIREDGQEYYGGCWLCNTDAHRDEMREAIERAREVAQREGV